MQETQVPSLGQEDPLEKGMATHSGILAWRIPWTERSLAGYSSWGHKESRYEWAGNTSSFSGAGAVQDWSAGCSWRCLILQRSSFRSLRECPPAQMMTMATTHPGTRRMHRPFCSLATDVLPPSRRFPFPMMFSSCSRKDLEASLEKGMGMCLFNLPEVKQSFGGQKCGNGYVEEGEECDCGEPEVREAFTGRLSPIYAGPTSKNLKELCSRTNSAGELGWASPQATFSQLHKPGSPSWMLRVLWELSCITGLKR